MTKVEPMPIVGNNDLNALGLLVSDHVSAMLLYWDKNQVCQFANEPVIDWYGISREEMIGKITIREISGDSYDQILPYIKGVLGGRAQTYEREVTNKQGKKRNSLINFFPHVVDGVVRGFFVHAADISQIKALETELIQKNEIILDQNRRLLNFANIISHNLRSYSSNLETILDMFVHAGTEGEKEEMLNYLKSISKRFSTTIDQLDEIAHSQKQGTIKHVRINLNDYVQRAIDILGIQIKSFGAVVINNVGDDLWLDVNPAYMESIVLNFLTNAIKYRHPDRKPVVEVNGYRTGDHVAITIKDNGIGINLEKHGKDLFGMYKTFHDNPDAHGIGLFITKFQVEAMGGRIEVESELDEGTTFKIYLKAGM